MRPAHQPDLHLTYCLNVHPGETWDACETAIRAHACAVRDRVAPGRPFGLGLRLGARAARELARGYHFRAFRDLLAAEGLYVFTINAFPYGRFHEARVKESVYRPDWRTPERVAYTCLLADLLAALLPEGVDGSLSTVPVGFAPDFASAAARTEAADRLLEAVRHLARIEAATGRRIHLGLEPEPACVLETSADFLAFYTEVLARAGSADEPRVRRHLGVCFDTCHAALAFEDPAEALDRYAAEGVCLSKVQLSAALRAEASAAGAALRPFAEPVYLHQVRARSATGAVRGWLDLDQALADPSFPGAGEARVHFHVPLGWRGDAVLDSTTGTLAAPFWDRLRRGACAHLEIETYTFDVLPPELRAGGVVASIAREFAWVMERLPAAG